MTIVMSNIPIPALFALAYSLGIRHGLDLDHIAAITDLTRGTNKRNSFMLGLIYAVGHASVIIFLGFIAVFISIHLPRGVDRLMEPVVGMTLVLLGIWVIFSILRQGNNFQMKSRFMLIFTLITRLINYLNNKLQHKHPHSISYSKEFNLKTAFIVGAIHGIGAETPTQILLFITAAGLSNGIISTLLIFIFVLGLITSNTIITLISIFGTGHNSNINLNIALNLIVAVFSIGVGVFLIL